MSKVIDVQNNSKVKDKEFTKYQVAGIIYLDVLETEVSIFKEFDLGTEAKKYFSLVIGTYPKSKVGLCKVHNTGIFMY